MTESSQAPQASSIPSEADSDFAGETAAPDESSLAGTDKDSDADSNADSDGIGVSDDDLPEDLQPGEDNPLAEPLDPDAEETKDAEELGMQDTQEDTTGTYRSEGDLESSDSTSADADDSEDDSKASS